MTAKKINITTLDSANIACNKICATIKAKGLPYNSVWLYINHLIQNIEHESNLTVEQQETITALFNEYLKIIETQKSLEVIQQQGVHFLEEINQMKSSRLESKIREEQIFSTELLSTISRYLGELYDDLHPHNTTTIIETFKTETIQAIRKASNKKSIIQLVEASFDKVNSAVVNNIATARDSVESMFNLESKAVLDPLTGVFNRRYYDQELPKIIKTFCKMKGKKPFSILALDIDYFKQVNDAYGHFIGDVSLQHIAGIIQKNCRAGIDSPIRNGGDEFIIFLIGANEEIALKKAEKIRNETANRPVYFSRQTTKNETEKISCNLTLSIGVCELNFSWDSIPAKDLITSMVCPAEEMSSHKKLTLKLAEAVDQALYEAKIKGRNRVCVYKS